ncbi:hypothetical protein [Mucilaginibacter sp. SJ]|uniref:hypothetical protein n=1 Tax=Mucilaginibacter sp. SJ TaxID=3029053 RepID=UPI0023A9C96D|nr:hypothetical protein [Mucilaginibacter sp. SJ]WEA01753.1 hypothetical protein MusilaSJ_02305 [Mucilaginibacter sp. SJ]
MEAAKQHNILHQSSPLQKVIESFFKGYTPDSTKFMFWKLFQCWALKDCTIKAEVSDEEVALFFDQLIDLVAAAYTVHQANGATPVVQKGLGGV